MLLTSNHLVPATTSAHHNIQYNQQLVLNINYIILVCNFQLMIFAVAACGSVYCTACSVCLCLLLVSDDSPLTEPSESMAARVGCWQIRCLAVPSVCTRLLCLARGLSLAPRCPPAPLFLKDDNDKRGGGEWVGCENPLQILSLWGQSHSICS